MINLLPWRSEHNQKRIRLSLFLLFAPSLLFLSLHGLYIGLSYLELISSNQSIRHQQQQLEHLKVRVAKAETEFVRYLTDKERYVQLEKELATFDVSNPLQSLPRALPKGVFVNRLSCVEMRCQIFGSATSFETLNRLVNQFRSSDGIEEVQLELQADNSKQVADFELGLAFTDESVDALAIR